MTRGCSDLPQRRQELAERIAQALGVEAVKTKDGPKVSNEEGYSVCLRLQGFGLAHEVPFNVIEEIPIREYCFRPSKRGLLLLKLLGEEVYNWDDYFPPRQK